MNLQKYMDLLKEHNIKITPQRLAIIQLMDQHGHISVRDIYDKIKERFPSLSLATVYKNINAMMENQFINELKIAGHENKYELAKERHSHSICRKCGEIEDVYIDTTTLADALPKESEFNTEEVSVHFFGLCKKCAS
jgi:Fur family peroxide stress response transcriptional regulator